MTTVRVHIDDDYDVTDKGRVAAVINGFELPVTELYFSGLLDWLDEVQILVVVGSLVFEERRGDLYSRMDKRLLGEHRDDVERIIGKLMRAEKRFVETPTVREPNFKIGAVIDAFADGADLEEIGELSNASPGDIIRVFRLAVQVLRQLRKAIRGNRKLYDRLGRAIDLINRDAVDAKRQLELG